MCLQGGKKLALHRTAGCSVRTTKLCKSGMAKSGPTEQMLQLAGHRISDTSQNPSDDWPSSMVCHQFRFPVMTNYQTCSGAQSKVLSLPMTVVPAPPAPSALRAAACTPPKSTRRTWPPALPPSRTMFSGLMSLHSSNVAMD